MANKQTLTTFQSLLTDKQQLVHNTSLMRLPTAKALTVLEVHGYNIKKGRYNQIPREIRKLRDDRIMYIAKEGFEYLHLETLDIILLCESEYWTNYHMETDHYKRTVILDKIIQVQPWKSLYIDATIDVKEKQMRALKLAQETEPDTIKLMKKNAKTSSSI